MTTTDPLEYTIRQGSTLPTLTITPHRDDGSAIDVTGATCQFLIRDVNLAAPLVVEGLDVISSLPAVLRYTPSPGDTDIAGEFLGECQIIYTDGTIESFPTSGFIPITIVPSLSVGGVPQPGGKSGADWIAETKNYLLGATREIMNVLGQDIGPTDTTFTLSHDTPMSLGDRLCIGMETMHVWSYDSRSNNVSVQRGVDGTQPLSASQGTLCSINPRFTDAQVWTGLKEALPNLQSSGIYQAKILTRVFVTPIRGLDLATDMVGDQILDVSYRTIDGLKVWRQVLEWEVISNVDPVDYPSGKMLYLAQDYIVPQLWPVRITYKASLGSLRSPADLVGTQTGLPDTALDLPPLYSAIRMLAGAPVQRANPTGQPTGRRTDEVSTSDVVNSASALQRLYAQRLSAEKKLLEQRWPYRFPRVKIT